MTMTGQQWIIISVITILVLLLIATGVSVLMSMAGASPWLMRIAGGILGIAGALAGVHIGRKYFDRKR